MKSNCIAPFVLTAIHLTNIHTNEPFGLGRFATDLSLTKAASRPLFARVRRYARLKETTKNIIFEISMLDYPFGRWNQVNPTIFEICLLYVNNNNKYPYEKFLNAKFGISILVYLY